MIQIIQLISKAALFLLIIASSSLSGNTCELESKTENTSAKEKDDKFQEFGCKEDFHRCDCFYCQCKPLLRGIISTDNQITGVHLDTFSVTVPVISATGYGEGIQLSPTPLVNGAGITIAEAGRIDIKRCGWYRIGLYGEILYNGTTPVTVTLKSSLLGGDIVIGVINPPSRLEIRAPIPYSVNNTAFMHFTNIPTCCWTPLSYTVVLSNIDPGTTTLQFTPGANSRVIFQRMGPCEKCKKEKSCCCPKCSCER